MLADTLDPATITPAQGKVLIEREERPEKVGRIFTPRPEEWCYKGTVVAIGANPGADYEALVMGDKVWFGRYQHNVQNSIFFDFEDKEYVLGPADLILAVRDQ